MVTPKTIARKGWILQLARQPELKRSLKEFDWAELRKGSAEDALNYLYEILWLHLRKHIPFKDIREKKQFHP